MTLVASNISANIASLQDEIEELRRSAKHDLSDCANLRSVSANSRERIAPE